MTSDSDFGRSLSANGRGALVDLESVDWSKRSAMQLDYARREAGESATLGWMVMQFAWEGM